METETSPAAASKLSTPAAILLGAALIAGAVLVTQYIPAPNKGANADLDTYEAPTGDLEAMRPISADDHIIGDPNAPVKIVEYSDTECPFCKRFHISMQEIMETYGKEGKVAWVYRHFPLDQLHAKARPEAIATECAAAQGGNEAFWAYLDRMMEVTPSNDGLEASELPKIAAHVGLDSLVFSRCLVSNDFADRIKADERNAVETGGQGTPWSIVVGPNGKKYELSGAQPVASIKQLIDIALADK